MIILKRCFTTTAILCLTSLMFALMEPVMASDISPSSFNVKDFGAVGDGVTDDTDAIQKAVNASVKSQKTPFTLIQQNYPPGKTAAKLLLRSEIVFPDGTYLISRPIVFDDYAYIRGFGKSVIKQKNPKQDIFYFNVKSKKKWVYGTHWRISGLKFQGGKTHMRFWTRNVNASMISIYQCEFIESSSYPIECLSFLNPEWNSKRILKYQKHYGLVNPQWVYWKPYLISWKNGMPYMSRNPARRGDRSFNSTLMRIEDCKFDQCMGVVDVSPDTLFMRNIEATINPKMSGAVFSITGLSKLSHVKCTITPERGKDPYWIKGTILAVRDCEFETGTKRGIDFIEPYGAGIFNIENVRVKVAGGKHNALFWFKTFCQPRCISIINVTETSGKRVKAIRWEAPEKLKHLELYPKTWKRIPVPAQYEIILARNSKNIDCGVPSDVKKLLKKAPSAGLLKTVTIPQISWKSYDLWSKFKTVLYAGKHGVDSNPETDDTKTIQKLFDDAAAVKGGAEVVFPAGIYLVSEPIRLPGEVYVRGAGLAAFIQKDIKKDVFIAENPKALAFCNVLIKFGRNGINIVSKDGASGRIAFTDCWFVDNLTGIRCMPNDGRFKSTNNIEILVDGGYNDSIQGVVSDASKTYLRAFWVFNGRNLGSGSNGKAFCENRGGSMLMDSVLYVPHRWKSKLFNNVRWVDNWGKFNSMDVRYGGEAKGMCIVHNRSSDGIVYITGGMARFANPAVKKCILYLEKSPKSAVLYNISTVPWSTGKYKGVSRVLSAPGVSLVKNVFVAGVAAPQASK